MALRNGIHLKKGQYAIKNLLGIGNFGNTYRAYDRNLDRSVVIKEYFPAEFSQREKDGLTVSPIQAQSDKFKWGLDRFKQEAKILAKFKHPNIVEILDTFDENNTSYFVMPFEDGMTLSDYIRNLRDNNKTLDEIRVRHILTSILNALNQIHNKNIFHRDIKPDNIFLRKNNIPMLIDFGAARQYINENTKMTAVLTPQYAPKEQYISAEKNKQGPWTDIYALGMTLYEITHNRTPPTVYDRIDALSRDIEDPLKFDYTIPYSEKLIDAIKKMTEMRIEDRPQNVREVFDILEGRYRNIDFLEIGTTLKNSKYKIEDILSSNSSSKFEITYKASDKDGNTYIIKELFPKKLALRENNNNLDWKRDRKIFKDMLNSYLKNAQTLKKAHSEYPNMVKVVDIFKENNTAYYVMSYYEGKTLTKLIDNVYDEKSIINIAISILKELDIVHKKGLLHKNIKLNNIYLKNDKNYILIDYILLEHNHIKSIKNAQTSIKEKSSYAPIEFLKDNLPVGPWSDIYLLGISLYELTHKSNIFHTLKRQEALNKGESNILEINYNLKYSPELLKIIKRMIELNPEDRPKSAKEIIDELNSIEMRECKSCKSTFSSQDINEDGLCKNCENNSGALNFIIILLAFLSGGLYYFLNN